MLHIFHTFEHLFYVIHILYRFITDTSAPCVPIDIPPTDGNRSDALFLNPYIDICRDFLAINYP